MRSPVLPLSNRQGPASTPPSKASRLHRRGGESTRPPVPEIVYGRARWGCECIAQDEPCEAATALIRGAIPRICMSDTDEELFARAFGDVEVLEAVVDNSSMGMAYLSGCFSTFFQKALTIPGLTALTFPRSRSPSSAVDTEVGGYGHDREWSKDKLPSFFHSPAWTVYVRRDQYTY